MFSTPVEHIWDLSRQTWMISVVRDEHILRPNECQILDKPPAATWLSQSWCLLISNLLVKCMRRRRLEYGVRPKDTSALSMLLVTGQGPSDELASASLSAGSPNSPNIYDARPAMHSTTVLARATLGLGLYNVLPLAHPSP
jgi:hypothetical protein